jgi:hypothetical protein
MKGLIKPKIRSKTAAPSALRLPGILRKLPILGLLCLPVLSCAGGSGSGSWASYPEMPAYWNYELGDIQVTVDHVREDGAASQIGVIAETLLAAGNKEKIEGGIPLIIDIRVEQRSFLHSVELLNTIYMDCRIRDGEGRILGRTYRYSVGKRSILSAKEQRRLLGRAMEKILKDRRKRDREAGGYRKNDA